MRLSCAREEDSWTPGFDPMERVPLDTNLGTSVSFRSYVANRVTDKLTQIHNHIFCCRSGSAADTQAIADAVTYQLGFHR